MVRERSFLDFIVCVMRDERVTVTPTSAAQRRGLEMNAIWRGAMIVSIVAGWWLALAQPCRAFAAEKVRVLIIDGQNNHNWRAMTPPMKAELERSGRFTVDVVTTLDRKPLVSCGVHFVRIFPNTTSC